MCENMGGNEGREQEREREILRVWVLLWQVWLCSCASSACLPLERHSSVSSLSAYSSPCYLGRESTSWQGYFHGRVFCAMCPDFHPVFLFFPPALGAVSTSVVQPYPSSEQDTCWDYSRFSTCYLNPLISISTPCYARSSLLETVNWSTFRFKRFRWCIISASGVFLIPTFLFFTFSHCLDFNQMLHHKQKQTLSVCSPAGENRDVLQDPQGK